MQIDWRSLCEGDHNGQPEVIERSDSDGMGNLGDNSRFWMKFRHFWEFYATIGKNLSKHVLKTIYANPVARKVIRNAVRHIDMCGFLTFDLFKFRSKTE